MREVAIIGQGMTDFKNKENGLVEMASEASLEAIRDSNTELEDFDAIYFANMASGVFNGQTGVASALADRISLLPADAHRIENGPASGGSAIRSAFMGVASGYQDLVLVTGSEKMTEVPRDTMADLLASLNHPEVEYKQGISIPGMAGMFTRLYMDQHGVTEEELAAVAVKNHSNAEKNPKAQYRGKSITVQEVKDSPMISDPLRLFHTCPVTDGAASLVLCRADAAKEYSDEPVDLVGSGQATDAQSLEEREDPLRLKSVEIAADEAFQMANLDPSDIEVVEIHDAFAVLELAELEAAGFFEPGEAGEATLDGKTSLGGELPVNPSGGLKARGHPVGATGVAQAVEVVNQLRNDSGERQVKNAERGLCCNFGGFGNNTVVHLLEANYE